MASVNKHKPETNLGYESISEQSRFESIYGITTVPLCVRVVTWDAWVWLGERILKLLVLFSVPVRTMLKI